MGKTRLAVWGLLLATFLLLGLLIAYSNQEVAQPQRTPLPAQGPLTGFTCCVDAGHGGYDGGAKARSSRVWEKALNLDTAMRLGELLIKSGALVIYTRTEDAALAGDGANRKRRDLQARVDSAATADVFISLHMNEYRDSAQSGPQVFYRARSDAGRLLAGALQDALNQGLSPARKRAANTGEYYVLNNLSIPAVLVECGFLSNPAEEKLLLDPSYRQRIAQAVHDGLCEYVRLTAGVF